MPEIQSSRTSSLDGQGDVFGCEKRVRDHREMQPCSAITGNTRQESLKWVFLFILTFKDRAHPVMFAF